MSYNNINNKKRNYNKKKKLHYMVDITHNILYNYIKERKVIKEMKNVKLVTYSERGLMFEEYFENMHQLKQYVKSCGGFRVLEDYEIYTLDNEYRYNNTSKIWVKL